MTILEMTEEEIRQLVKDRQDFLDDPDSGSNLPPLQFITQLSQAMGLYDSAAETQRIQEVLAAQQNNAVS